MVWYSADFSEGKPGVYANTTEDMADAHHRLKAEGATAIRFDCPDGGWCHHECEKACYRVRACGPLSGVFENDEWPPEIRASHKSEGVGEVNDAQHD